MKKSDLIDRLSLHFRQLTKADAQLSVEVILDAISNHLSMGCRAEIRGFGSFQLNSRPPRLGRNPKTGEKVHVPAKHVPHFKPGKELREKVNEY